MEPSQESHIPEIAQVQILPVENGYLITAYYPQAKPNIPDLMTHIMKGMQGGGDPAEAFAKTLGAINIRESVKRKATEHHVAKSVEEALHLVSEILASMNSMKK